jgi:hypothetical protein
MIRWSLSVVRASMPWMIKESTEDLSAIIFSRTSPESSVRMVWKILE